MMPSSVFCGSFVISFTFSSQYRTWFCQLMYSPIRLAFHVYRFVETYLYIFLVREGLHNHCRRGYALIYIYIYLPLWIYSYVLTIGGDNMRMSRLAVDQFQECYSITFGFGNNPDVNLCSPYEICCCIGFPICIYIYICFRSCWLSVWIQLKSNALYTLY